VKIGAKQTVELLLDADSNFLDEETRKLLMVLHPDPEEGEMEKLESVVQEIKGHDKEPADYMEKLDWFMYCLGKLPRLQQRIECILIIGKLEDDANVLKRTFGFLSTAIKHVRESKELEFVLRAALGIGNFINGGSSRGGAYGFKFSSLMKMAEARASSGSHNLLQVVLGEAAMDYSEQKDGSPDSFLESLKDLMEEFTEQPVTLPQLRDMVQALQKAQQVLRMELDKLRPSPIKHFLTSKPDVLPDLLEEVVEDIGEIMEDI